MPLSVIVVGNHLIVGQLSVGANGVSVEGSQIPCDATPMCDAHAAEESLEHSRTIPMQAHLISIS